MKKKFFGCWYFYIHSMLKAKSINNTMNYNDAKKLLFLWRVPKFIAPIVIKELEILDLVQRNKKKTIIFKESKINLDSPYEVYHLMGIY